MSLESQCGVKKNPVVFDISRQVNKKGTRCENHLVPFLSFMAEREGFEPSVESNPHTRLAGEHHRPLGHLSAH
jgi:hypothetical protein